ncbi:hypothetical protein L1987_43113 [Smallanthus sonchifolius]|uniref:Uncharacterized protein n=1 Tax=Smallanthus sonchifolius TaxID=185202 RepID=A0ACB9GKU7_9ASTR|nr:hypothetical protein L1987_43113 [Smallanthus sonchifolius]
MFWADVRLAGMIVPLWWFLPVATKDIHVDPLTSLSLRIFLPDSVLAGSGDLRLGDGVYNDYSPALGYNLSKLSVVLQFHGGGFVTRSSISLANVLFCGRIAKACDAIVVAVVYQLALENEYLAAFEDGVEALNWSLKVSKSGVKKKNRHDFKVWDIELASKRKVMFDIVETGNNALKALVQLISKKTE